MCASRNMILATMIFIVYYRDMADPNDMWQPIESIGPTGTAVAANIKRLRDGLPFTELSSRLTDLGRPIPPLGLRKIESGGRRVDTDDLLALAVALGVSPITLLMPADVVMTTTVTATGVVDGKLSAKRLWNWLNASYALQGAVMAFYARALPSWERAELEKGMGPTMAGLMDLRGP